MATATNSQQLSPSGVKPRFRIGQREEGTPAGCRNGEEGAMKDASPAIVTTLQHVAAATLAGGIAFLLATVLGAEPFRPTMIAAAVVFFKLAVWDNYAKRSGVR